MASPGSLISYMIDAGRHLTSSQLEPLRKVLTWVIVALLLGAFFFSGGGESC